jgi:mRNA-degrading endonuclease HigB of HigAB toxin-antitoxin module
MNRDKLENALKSIGKKSFVEDYEVYSNHNISLNKKVEVLSKKYSQNGSAIRISFADNIFKNGKQKEALAIIIDSPRISNEVKKNAKTILVDLE